ncbi:unnamed protein product, partial [Closterium sp. Naga37s-1]
MPQSLRPHSSPALVARTRRQHSSHALVASTRRTHSSPALVARTRRQHSSHALVARTRRTHSSHALDAGALRDWRPPCARGSREGISSLAMGASPRWPRAHLLCRPPRCVFMPLPWDSLSGASKVLSRGTAITAGSTDAPCSAIRLNEDGQVRTGALVHPAAPQGREKRHSTPPPLHTALHASPTPPLSTSPRGANEEGQLRT